jgi:hypothetical protein
MTADQDHLVAGWSAEVPVQDGRGDVGSVQVDRLEDRQVAIIDLEGARGKRSHVQPTALLSPFVDGAGLAIES